MQEPPIWHVSGTEQLVAGLLFGAALVVATVWAIRIARAERQPWPLVVLGAAGLIVFGEPFVDVLGQCMFPVDDVTGYVDTFGRQIPLYMAPVYFFYFGTSMVWTMLRVRGGVTMKAWMGGYAGLVAFDLCFEPIFIELDWWGYYGDNQCIRFFDLPIWWGFANSAAVIATGAFLAVLLRRLQLTGWQTLVLVPILPASFMGFHTMLAFPYYSALNSTDEKLWTNFAMLITVALSITMVWMSGKLVTTDGLRTAPESPSALPKVSTTA